MHLVIAQALKSTLISARGANSRQSESIDSPKPYSDIIYSLANHNIVRTSKSQATFVVSGPEDNPTNHKADRLECVQVGASIPKAGRPAGALTS